MQTERETKPSSHRVELDRRARLQKTPEGDQWNRLNLTKISKPIESRDNGAYRDAVSQIFRQFSQDRYHTGIRPKSQVSLACTRRGNAPWPCINPASRWYTDQPPRIIPETEGSRGRRRNRTGWVEIERGWRDREIDRVAERGRMWGSEALLHGYCVYIRRGWASLSGLISIE